MIDRNHDLTVTRQAELLDINRGAVYDRPGQSVRPIWRSCAASTSCIWNIRSWLLV